MTEAGNAISAPSASEVSKGSCHQGRSAITSLCAAASEAFGSTTMAQACFPPPRSVSVALADPNVRGR
eukprot:CAMPEP_0180792526 /NCGR_PEP_ID=MMETSP1038_2-20121128/54456_1 /TAXON_ID=632150 /ORGANISM="Azadinium spinosum, Strain 3D9" /LENGTH=67 /DNA_ID=CAMNT_0022830871 /DNA_START=392 /DNA_END=595 /DNA_ORIENTATION=+